ncbi:metal-sulfur cluster assembly factor [Nocardia amamiensis]|uniref:metal-sulfur cluster assembly factor n=1 Tax=Nocardia TaxID=1817 RepID=UPI0033DEACFF
MSNIADAIRTALQDVVDPCSVAAGAPINIIDMGLVLDIDVDSAGHARILIRTTSPMCTLVGSIAEGAERAACSVPGVTEATVEVDPRPGWTESDMTDDGRVFLELRRARSRREVPVQPREWERRARGADLGHRQPIARAER